MPVNESNAQFLADLFGDDDTLSRSHASLEEEQIYSEYDSKNSAIKSANTLRQRKETRKMAPEQSDDGNVSGKRAKGGNSSLCLDQALQKDAAQKADAYLYDNDLMNGDSIMT